MGRKRNWTGQRFYLFIAGLMIVVLGGCTAFKDMQGNGDSMDAARQLFEHGDYDGALKEYQKIISSCGKRPPADEALFYAGLIYAHQGYAKGDHGKSVDCFKKVVKTFPASPYAGQARIWVSVLQAHDKTALEAIELSKALKKAHYDQERLNREIDELRKTIKKSKEVDIEIDGKKKELSK